tara:strand:+ start:9950 stop:10228 length:279 start_codon:yes stop_codon:yes gene_type:complete
MTVSILAYDIPGSEMTHYTGKDYKQQRAVRKFFVGSTTETKDTIINSVKTTIGTTHPHNFGVSNSNLPLQTMTASKVGRDRWIVTAQYYYPF